MGCDESFQEGRSSDVPCSFEPNSGLAGAESCLCHAVLRETWEEPFERPLPNLIVDGCRPLFLHGCVAVNPQDMVDTTDAQTFFTEGELCLRILAELDALVHCPGTPQLCLPRGGQW